MRAVRLATMPMDPAGPTSAPGRDSGGFTTLFDLLPVGAYRSTPQGQMLRANRALVRFNGYETEHELLARCTDLAREWYVDPNQRARFIDLLERDGQLTGFVSEVVRHRTGERVWVTENAHLVRDEQGAVLYYEGTIEEITDRVREQAALQRSEAHLRLITNQLPGMVFRVRYTPQGKRVFDFVSEGSRRLFNLEPQQLMQDSTLLEALRHPDDRERVAEAIRSSVRDVHPLTIEFRILLPEPGGERMKWLQVTSAPVPSQNADSVRIGVMIDITQSKQAEAALRESEERWKLAFEATGDGVWDVDFERGTEMYSAQLMQMYGFAEGEVGDWRLFLDQRTHPDDIAQMQAAREAHYSGRAPSYVNEHRVLCKDGSWKWVLTRGLVIRRDEAGRPLRMIGTHTDITAQKQTAELRAQRDRAESADQAKTQLLSRVSHELRTPLNAVLGFGQLLDTDPELAPRHRNWIRQILASGQHLLELVDDVLDLSRAQAGQLNLSPTAVSLPQAIAEAWGMLNVAHAATAPRPPGLRFIDETAAAPPLWVHADPRRLRQVLSNLFSNAIKYNRAGGEVRVSAAAQDDGMVELRVADTGRGMTPDQLQRLFQPFERLGAQHTAVQGTGLGLALCKQLVEAMGGRIEPCSEAGVGSTFVVRLRAWGAVLPTD
jgi:PAS domain S-box-containing protein